MNKPSKEIQRKIVRRVLISLLIAILCLTLTSAYFLKKGIQQESLSIGPVTISEMSLVWHDKLELEIAQLSLAKSQDKRESDGRDNPSKLMLRAIYGVSKLFSKVIIREITVSDIKATLYLFQDTNQESYFNLTSNDLIVKSDITFDQGNVSFNIKEASSKKFNSTASGNLVLAPQPGTLTGDVTVNVSGSFPITIQFTADSQHISFQGKESGEINTITPLVDLFGLDPNIQRWITEYLHGSRYNLKKLSGSGTFKDPLTFLDNLYAEVRVEGCEYTFAPGLEPIKTTYTDVTFSEGVLTIKPHESFFYGQSCEDSWLDINFNTPSDILLTAYIKTHAKANHDILTLLNYYKISLPFIQTEGKTAVDLTLAIHLNDMRVSANGTFHINEGVLSYNQQNLNVSGVNVTLANSDINIQSGKVEYQGFLQANLSGLIQTGKNAGVLNIEIEKADLPIGKSTLIIDESLPHLSLAYHFQKDKQWIEAKASSWKLDATEIKLGPFSTPFSLEDLSADLPPVLLTIPPGVSAHISGYTSITKKKIDLQCDLFQYKLKDLIMTSPSVPITISFDKTLTIRNKKTSEWLLNNVPLILSPSEFTYSNNVVSLVDSTIRYSSFFDSHVSGKFDHKLQQGTFHLTELDIKADFINQQLGLADGLTVNVNNQDQGLVIAIPDLDLRIGTNPEGKWSAAFTDLASLHDRSPLLKQYHLDAGSLTVSSKNGKKPYNFSAEVPYTSPVLMKDNTPIDLFKIKGVISEEGVTASVNEDLKIQYTTDKLTINSENFGFNIPAIISLLEKRSPEQTAASKKRLGLTYSMHASNSGLYLSTNSKLLADTMQLDHSDGKTTMKLNHGPGTIDLEITGENFSCKGGNLNDVFMTGLAQNGRFKNGSMSIAAMGSFDHFSVLFNIKDTTLKNFKTFTNMMAFINTIPALLTFSRPNYNKDGLQVSSAVLGGRIDDGIATINSLGVESPSLSIAGAGSIDFPQKKIDMQMNLITSAKSSINKIPLVGYVLVGDEKRPSITMSITGDLQDPTVKNSMYRDIATTPFSVLYRTLKLPSRLINSEDESSSTQQNTQHKPEE